MFKYYYHFTANPAIPDCFIPVGCHPKDSEISCTDNGFIDMGDCNGPPKRCRQRNIKPDVKSILKTHYDNMHTLHYKPIKRPLR
jgi:hypothetical protein